MPTITFDLKDIYQNNPSDKAINQKDPLILGMTCALWTDDGVTERMIDRRLFPRILALAEQMWYQERDLTLPGSTKHPSTKRMVRTNGIRIRTGLKKLK